LKIDVLIIGLGDIGLNYDYNINVNKIYKSHSKSLFFSKKFNLLGGVEIKNKIKKKFISKYNIPVFKSIEQAMSLVKPVMVIISVPTKIHYSTFKDIQKFKFIKYILFEKPVGKNKFECKNIIKLGKKNDKIIFVNYIRQYQNDLIIYLNKLKKNKNKIIDCNIHYNRGLLNNASHLILFIKSIFGKIIKIDNVKDNIYNDIRDLKSPNFTIYFLNLKVDFIYVNNYKKNINKIIFNLVNKKIIISNNKQTINTYKKSKLISKIKTNMNKYQLNVYENIYNNINGKKSNICDVKEALKIHEIIENIFKKI
jgi:predicted dehydrogenase